MCEPLLNSRHTDLDTYPNVWPASWTVSGVEQWQMPLLMVQLTCFDQRRRWRWSWIRNMALHWACHKWMGQQSNNIQQNHAHFQTYVDACEICVSYTVRRYKLKDATELDEHFVLGIVTLTWFTFDWVSLSRTFSTVADCILFCPLSPLCLHSLKCLSLSLPLCGCVWLCLVAWFSLCGPFVWLCLCCLLC